MAIYELRTYSVVVGKMGEVVSLYANEGWPALARHPQKLVGYFTGDVGALNELIHVWKFDDDADRRAFWGGSWPTRTSWHLSASCGRCCANRATS